MSHKPFARRSSSSSSYLQKTFIEGLENRTLLATLANGIDPANIGKGEWIWIVTSAQANLGVSNVEGLAMKMKEMGFKWVIVKAGDGNDGPITGSFTQFNSTLIDAFHAQGIKIFGYVYPYGGADPSPKTAVTTVEGEIAVAKEVLSLNPDGLILDAEGQYERVPVTSHGGPVGAATDYMVGIRAAYPNTFIAHAPLPYITLHTAFPYEVFGKYCDAVMPQCYWRTLDDTPANTQSPNIPGQIMTPTDMVEDLDAEWSYWQTIWASRGNADAIKPIIPIAQGYDPVTKKDMQGSEITEFIEALKNDKNPATAGGYKGVSFWSAQHHTTTMFQAIKAETIGFNGIVKGTVFDDVNGDGKRGVGEDGVVGRVVYDDVDNDKHLDADEPQGTTDASGNYTLTNLSGIVHKLRLVPLDGFRQSSPASGFAAKATLAADGDTLNNVNFGVTGMASVSGVVFLDKNGSAAKEKKEIGLKGWRIYVDADGNGRFTDDEINMRTDVTGAYDLAVNSGISRLRIVPVEGWRQTLPTDPFYDVNLAIGEGAVKNFGETNRLLISGYVFNDLDANGVRKQSEEGLEAVRVFVDLDRDGLFDDNEYNTLTDETGRYVFRNVPAGKYQVRVLPQVGASAGWAITSPSLGFHTINLSSGQTISNRLFGEHHNS